MKRVYAEEHNFRREVMVAFIDEQVDGSCSFGVPSGDGKIEFTVLRDEDPVPAELKSRVLNITSEWAKLLYAALAELYSARQEP